MKNFKLHFECYRQMRTNVEIKAKDLDDAIEQARELDLSDAYWEEADCPDTNPRLYGILNSKDKYLAEVTTPMFTWSFSWTHVDLRNQWRRVSKVGPKADQIYELTDKLEAYFRRLVPWVEPHATPSIAKTLKARAGRGK